ncbi:hypothetical protein VOI32_03035 [Paraburkholderia caribensis]|uniref:Uracil-DNA glycosylase-like domain-containing protein n=1 Tax=Paraburkholderia caribensis TaxID=75105 RepID=A0A9Q6S5K4_9BURK|nr:hypothetical protein [Paraburkholderia caribensis]MCO4882973.1 hypothetical protein [Paraburkholderia caribensis]PTB30683.1 hypothetical protein C9I56_00215 [Paraburkholderia caribensis]QLB65587.1 hypothetical protein A9O66_24745 [Paraburkholderia caribensis]
MDEILEGRYAGILADVDPSFLNHEVAKERKLSTPFLVNGPRDADARRIMVIGREFGGRGWYVKNAGDNPRAYVSKALIQHQTFFDKCMAQKESDKGVTFFNFMRALAKKVGSGGLIYSNLLCFDSVGKAPNKSKYFAQIKDLSKRLLDAQLEHFKPDVIIFANGMSTVGVRREFFPISGERKVCVSRRHWQETGISKDQLWEFELLDKYLCYRIQHPATIRGRSDAEVARRQLLEVLGETSPAVQLLLAASAGAGGAAIAARK